MPSPLSAPWDDAVDDALRGGQEACQDGDAMPEPTSPDDTFRCAKWSCTLAVKHCLRRQTETREAGRNAVHKPEPVPVHPYCANECETGRGFAARFGAGEQLVPLRLGAFGPSKRATVPPVAAFPITKEEAPKSRGAGGGHRTGPDDDAARVNAASGMERPAASDGGDARGEVIAADSACRTEASPPQEEPMPRGKRDEPWPCCGSMSHRHLKTCTQAGARKLHRHNQEEAAKPVEVVPRARRAPKPDKDLAALSDDGLLELEAAIAGEKRRRVDEAQERLRRMAVPATLGSVLDAAAKKAGAA